MTAHKKPLRETLFPERRYRVKQVQYAHATVLIPEAQNAHGDWVEMYEHIEFVDGDTIPNTARTIVRKNGTFLDWLLQRSYEERILRAIISMTQWIQAEHAQRSPPNTTGLIQSVTDPIRKGTA